MTVIPQPGFDVAALDEWIGDRLPGGAPLRATRLGQGAADGAAHRVQDGARLGYQPGELDRLECQAGLPYRAAGADRLGSLDLRDDPAGLPDREEQPGVEEAAGS
jgi:hypothetical protein